MVSGNFPSNFARILSPQALSLKLDAIKLEAFAQAFSAGDTLQGKVTQVLRGGRAVVQFQGKPVLLELSQILRPGQVLTARVEQTTPTPILKLIDPAPAASSGPRTRTEMTSATPAGKPDRPPDVTTTLSRQAMRRSNAGQPAPPPAMPEGAEKEGPKPTGREGVRVSENPSVPPSTVRPKTAEPPSTLKSNTPAPLEGKAPTQPDAAGASVTRLSAQGEKRAPAEPVFTRQDLQRLQIEPKGRTVLPAVRPHSAGTLIVKTGEGELAVKMPYALLFRSGDPVVITPRPVENGFVLEARPVDQMIRPVTPSLLKPLMTARQPMDEMVAALKQAVRHPPVLQELKIDPELVSKLRDTLRLLSPSAEKTVEAPRMQEMVDRSGVQYESKVSNLLLQEGRGDRSHRLQYDLKGQLMEFASRLEEAAQKPGAFSRPLQEILQTIHRSVQNIEFHQLSHQFSKQEQLPQLLPLPQSWFDDGSQVKIYVRREGEGESGGPDKKRETFNLVFLLDMTALGPLRVDARVRPQGLSVSIEAENPAVVAFLQAHIPDMETRMQEMGLPANITATLKEKVDRDLPDLLTQWVIQEPTRLVDIET